MYSFSFYDYFGDSFLIWGCAAQLSLISVCDGKFHHTSSLSQEIYGVHMKQCELFWLFLWFVSHKLKKMDVFILEYKSIFKIRLRLKLANLFSKLPFSYVLFLNKSEPATKSGRYIWRPLFRTIEKSWPLRTLPHKFSPLLLVIHWVGQVSNDIPCLHVLTAASCLPVIIAL